MFPKYNGWSVCDSDQKVSFYNNKPYSYEMHLLFSNECEYT